MIWIEVSELLIRYVYLVYSDFKGVRFGRIVPPLTTHQENQPCFQLRERVLWLVELRVNIYLFVCFLFFMEVPYFPAFMKKTFMVCTLPGGLECTLLINKKSFLDSLQLETIVLFNKELLRSNIKNKSIL